LRLWEGVGHSTGACLTTIVQATADPYEAVALPGYGVEMTKRWRKPDWPDSDACSLSLRCGKVHCVNRIICQHDAAARVGET
jgi:hypothetical protein